MKKTKALAILMAMTLTFSMFATAASAVDVGFHSREEEYSLGDISDFEFKVDAFKANLQNAKYAALFDFDFTKLNVDAGGNNYVRIYQNHTMTTPIVGAANNEQCQITITSTDDLTNTKKRVYHYDYADSVESGINPRFVSGTDCMAIQNGVNITITFNENADLKPVAIGYAFNLNKDTNATIANDVTINLSDDTSDVCDWTSPNTSNKPAKFYGYKAPVGKYIKSFNISNVDGGNYIRIDDLCIVYEETEKIEEGIRFSADYYGYVEFNDVDQLTNSSHIRVDVASEKGEGKKVILALYGAKEKFLWVGSTSENLYVRRNMSTALADGLLKKVRAFIWDNGTLVPVGECATVTR